MKSIIFMTMRLRRASTIWWSVGLMFFMFINMVFYPTFKNQAAELEKSFESIPDAALQLFGGSADFFSPVGFLNSQVFFLMFPLLLTMLAVGLGSSLLAREEQDNTIEMLLARPISRSKLLLIKALAGGSILVTVWTCTAISIELFAKLYGIEVSGWYIFLASFDCLLLALATGAISFLLTATGRARGAAIGIGALIGIGGYLVSSLAGTVAWLQTPSKVFPFHYYQSEATLRGNHDWINMLFPLAIITVCAALSYIAFRRRDIG